ncbi:MAG: heparan-alpha-glucosaminide N-acetyltransferase domain-containing protein [Arachnia propionica]|uniref:heparan-alpha-glucosaminide N-acetyltransferase domain-containing protein n=1 Tax=Arachnia propionica TaxID=1750 RepID=UPI00270A10DB|nr:heparan-alpha-glucosaminide N-acetyltransferase domain-containing protein [Arachnia propionica]
MTGTVLDPAPEPVAAPEAAPRPARSWWPRLRDFSRVRPRVRGLDAARGLAVLGMVVAHTVLTPASPGDPVALLNFANGRSAILFATIAGVSLAIMSGGRRRLEGTELMQARLTILGRAIVLLFLAGGLSLIPTSVQVILASYAFWFILALPALRWRPRTLLIVAACHATLGSFLVMAMPTWFPLWGGGGTDNAFVPLMIASSVYPAFVWMGFVLAGLALGRYGLDNVVALRNFLIVGLVLFIGFAAPFLIEARSLDPLFAQNGNPSSSISEGGEDYPGPEENWCLDASGTALKSCSLEELEKQLETMTEEQFASYEKLINEKLGIDESLPEPGDPEEDDRFPSIFDPTRPVDIKLAVWNFAPHSGTPFESFSSGGLALATIAGLVLLGRIAWSRFVLWPLTGVGAMALTAYVVHIIALTSIGMQPDELLVAGGLALGLVVLCSLWLRVFTSGPLEQLTGAVADRLAGRPRG